MKILMIGFIFFSMMLSGCSLLPIPRITKPKNVTTSSQSQNDKIYRESGYENVAGEAKKYTRYYKDFSKSKEKTVPKKTLMEKVGAWIMGLTLVSFLALIFLPPGVVTCIIYMLWSGKKRFKNGLKATVHAIKDVKADEQSELHNALKARHTEETKKVINTMKAEL